MTLKGKTYAVFTMQKLMQKNLKAKFCFLCFMFSA